MINIFQYLESIKGKKIPFKFKIFNNLSFNEDEELIVNYDLDLRYTNIEKLPDNLTINGYLELTSSKIKQLPKNLTVDGGLFLNFTDIKDLPDDLIVNGRLWCWNTPLGVNINNDSSLLKKYSKQVNGKIFYK